MKKVLGVIVAILVVIMVIVSIVNVIKNGEDKKKVKSYSYYTVYENGKFGVINNEGETVINPEYTEIVLIPNKDVPIFICTYDLNDQDGTYKTKVINQKNEEIFKEYSKVEAIDNFDSKQNIWYEDDVLRVEKDGKYGLINFEGKEIVPCEYDEITALKGVTCKVCDEGYEPYSEFRKDEEISAFISPIGELARMTKSAEFNLFGNKACIELTRKIREIYEE